MEESITAAVSVHASEELPAKEIRSDFTEVLGQGLETTLAGFHSMMTAIAGTEASGTTAYIDSHAGPHFNPTEGLPSM